MKGAACHSHEEDCVSYVLSEMKLPMRYARGTLRLSVGRFTTLEEIEESAQLIVDAVIELRENKTKDSHPVKRTKN